MQINLDHLILEKKKKNLCRHAIENSIYDNYLIGQKANKKAGEGMTILTISFVFHPVLNFFSFDFIPFARREMI